MSNRLMRGLGSRVAVGLAVLAFPLIATGAAQAALAGATPAQFTGVPNLRSATIDFDGVSNVVQVCFDKTLKTASGTTGFRLGGYRAGNLLNSLSFSLDQNNPNCEVVIYNSSLLSDENQYTFLEVTPGTVTANSPATGNLADSVALTGSTSHSGTTGVTTQPNLVGVLVPDSVHLSTNSLTFVFDKSVHVAGTGPAFTLGASGFVFETAAGSICQGQAVIGGQDSTTVTVTFNAGGGFTCGLGTATSVSQAVRALVVTGAITADQDASAPFTAPTEQAILPNCTSPCATSHPDLTSAALGTNQDQIVFTFDQNVVVDTPGIFTNGQTQFFAELANGQIIQSTGATLTGPNQITATYSGDLSNKAEYAVEAWANVAAAVAADNLTISGISLPGAVNIGGNAGAFADGFTTAPDSFGVSINHSNGQVIVNLDDRISAVNPGGLTLYTAQGLPIAIAPTSVSYNSSAGPGPLAVTLQYSPSGITNATALAIGQGAFVGPCPSTGTCTTPFSTVLADSQSVPQIDDPPNSAAILHAYKAYQAKHHRHLKHTRHHR
jgi:hypothetical protein